MENKELSMELERLAMPLVDFLKENYNPHSTVVITDSKISLVTDEIGIPVRNDD